MMNPEKYFIAPSKENRLQSGPVLNSVVDLILDHYANAKSRKLFPELTKNNAELFSIPEEAQPVDSLLSDLRLVFDGSMNHVSPNYIGHMDTMPTLMSIVGEMSAASINNNMLGLEMSPVFTRMEKEVLKSFCEIFGLPAASGGVMGSGGSIVNLQAMIIARNKMLDRTDGDITQLHKRPMLYTSELAHASIRKNMMIMGLGEESLITIPVDDQGRMDVKQLRKAVSSHNESQWPFCVVATAGTTTAGSIDPLNQIAELCSEHGMWFHVDAVYGGAAALSKKHRPRLTGIERADSITFNAQKWLMVAKTCSMLLLRDFNQSIQYCRMAMPYTSTDSEYDNLGEISVQGSRSAEILKLWLSLRHLGRKNYEKLIDESFELTAYFQSMVDQCDFLEKYAAAETNNLLFRAKHDNPNEFNNRLQQVVLEDQGFYFGLQQVLENSWLKFMPLNPFADREVICKAFESLCQAYERLEDIG